MSEMFSALRQKLPVSVRRAYRDTRARLLSLGLRDSLDILQPPEERKASGSMSIIIPVKDAPEVTRRCFLSLQRFAAAAEIIVVDDASKLAKGLRAALDKTASTKG